MKAMILAAGRGERLRPWTDTLPKPLLKVRGRRLIEHHLLALKDAGFEQVVINVAYKAGAIVQTLGDGSDYGLQIEYSHEQPGELDTGGGIRQALPLLGVQGSFGASFLVINADVLTDYPLAKLRTALKKNKTQAYLVLAPNPPHHPQGDFGLEDNLITSTAPLFTFTGIGVYRPELFSQQAETRFGLAPVLRQAINIQSACGEVYSGHWQDVGTPEAFERLGGSLN